ncbi:LPS assembly lipoprotein LptE [Salinarimonas ramus]|uniref:LPS-assembly lipoprotein n=1 Tax=Salinarimonas ramus TaxID=690164 RepID=A0A917Q7W7_9HYPH|nr:LPS assembly lipoprotein LptE [Salinarimonas ramus]GGK34520.1 hypothetical protein GCM10011322_21580 [Salinarimonas ramus]
MSSPDPRARRAPTRRAVLSGLACLAALPLAGCLTPLYGTAASNVALEQQLRAIVVEPVAVAAGEEEVLGHYLRQELVFALDGTGSATTAGPKAYRLSVRANATVSTPIVDSVTLRASVASLTSSATYTLATMDGSVVDAGTVTGVVTYERTVQRFASVRAGRDARIRVAKRLAEEMRTRIAIALRTAPATAAASLSPRPAS